MIVEQFVPSFHYGDAVGHSILTLHRFLTAQGVESRIVAQHIDDPRHGDFRRGDAVPLSFYTPRPETVKILHFGLYSPFNDDFIAMPGKKAMVYHNITPAEFFRDYSSELVELAVKGREQLRRIAPAFDLAVAPSCYNAGELQALHYRRVEVHPVLIDLDEYDQPCSRPYYELLRDDRINLVFVGRITPNKKIEDLLKILHVYKTYLSPAVRLIVAGNTEALPRYFQALRGLCGRLHLGADDVLFTGRIPFAELLAVYRLADLFVSMSEHEGFCLPLIESLHFGLPVVAYDAGAVGETLDGAGILVRDKHPLHAAALIEHVLHNEALRAELRRRAGERVARYRREADPHGLRRILESL